MIQQLKRLNAQDVELPLDEVFTDRWNSLSVDITKDDDEFIEELKRVINDETLHHEDEAEGKGEKVIPDTYVNMEIALPHGSDGNLVYATFKQRVIDENGDPVGNFNANPLIDSRLYEVEYIDGTIEKLTANAIADNIMSQVDEEGHRQLLLRDIVDHRINDEALKHKDSFYIVGDTKRRKKTTRGWQICVESKDGSTDWVELKDLKQSYPVKLARYARDNKLENDPAFAW